MLSLPEGSPRTRSLWGGRQRHAIRLDLTILGFSLLCLIFSTAQAFRVREVFILVTHFPALGLSAFFSSISIWAYYKRALYPIYSVSIATFLFSVWIVTFLFVVDGDIGNISGVIHGEGELGIWVAPPGLLIVKDLFFGIVTVLYVVYMVFAAKFAAKAVDDNRKRKRQGMLELDDDGMGIELVKRDVGT